MLFPIIRVKDCYGLKREHIVGENIHDTLYIDIDGGIHYINTHCMAGTKYPEEGYRFVGIDKGEYSIVMAPEIEMLTLDELIDFAADHLKDGTRKKIQLYKELRKQWNEELEKARKTTGVGFETGGFIP